MTPPAAWLAPLVRSGAILLALTAPPLAGCEAADTREPSATRESDAGTDPSTFDSGVELAFAVPEVGRVHIALDPPAVVDDPTGAWDLAFEGYDVFTNAISVNGERSGSVDLHADTTKEETLAEVQTRTADSERPRFDAVTAAKTTFDEWYDYDIPSNKLTPFAVTYVVRGGTGKLFKVRILSYYASPDGGASDVSGRFTLRVAPLDGGS